MASLLVVDDSLIDRRLMGGLLQADASNQISYAANGKEALTMLDEQPADAVITDLQMPEMDGLQLVTAIKKRFSQLPVILVTAKGSEEVAVQALQSGAASYVPKTSLSRDLLPTVRAVLALAVEQDVLSALMRYLVKSESEFTLPNNRASFPPLIRYLQACVTLAGLCFESERTRLGVALYEALTNALEHGNLEVGSARQAQDAEAHRKQCNERRRQPPYKNRKLHVSLRMTSEKAEFRIRDDGPGFDPTTASAADQEADFSDAAAGRGIVLMRAFMDEVNYNEAGNEVTLVKNSDYKLEGVVFDS